MNLHELEHLTVDEAVRTVGIGRTKFYELLRSGRVEAVKLGSRTLVKAVSLRAFMAELPQYPAGRP